MSSSAVWMDAMRVPPCRRIDTSGGRGWTRTFPDSRALGGSRADVQGVVIPGAGHWVAEEAPDEMLAALTPFLAAASPDGANANASQTVFAV